MDAMAQLTSNTYKINYSSIDSFIWEMVVTIDESLRKKCVALVPKKRKGSQVGR
jgi:hypothetical protein